MQVGGGVARAAGGAGVGAAVPRPGLGLREAGVHLGVSVGASGSLNRLIGEVKVVQAAIRHYAKQTACPL